MTIELKAPTDAAIAMREAACRTYTVYRQRGDAAADVVQVCSLRDVLKELQTAGTALCEFTDVYSLEPFVTAIYSCFDGGTIRVSAIADFPITYATWKRIQALV